MVIWYKEGSQQSGEGCFMFDTGHKKTCQIYVMNKGAL
jgi:hypothetical protein